MKKYVHIAFIYAAAAMAGGVFFREFTKFSDYTGPTTLRCVHTHLFMLGMVMFLLTALFARACPLEQSKLFRAFLPVYNLGVVLSAAMLLVRGVLQVLDTPLSTSADAAISGIAGIGHLLTGAGLVFWFLALKEAAED